MEYSRTQSGHVPLIMNVTVFSSTVISDGAVLVSGATSTAQGAAVSVNLDTTDGLNYIGVNQVSSSFATQSRENLSFNSHAFHIATSGITNSGSTGGLNYLPVCTTPFAAFFAQYSTTTGSGTASSNVATWTASLITAVQRGTTGTDVLGGWIFSLASANSAGNTPTFSGSLRYISNQSATTFITLLTAMNVSTDSHMIWVDRTWKKSGVLNSTANLLRSQSGSTGTGFQLGGVHMTRIENFVKHDQAPRHPLRQFVDDGLDGLTGAVFQSEVIFTQPFFADVA